MHRYSWILLALLISGPAFAAEMVPFPVDWNGDAASPASAAFLLEAPAGKHGFIKSQDGHLARGDGQRFRIWGVNLTGKATTPSKETAPRLVAHLARCGVNCVRFHFLDRPAPQGLIDAKRDDTRAFDAEQLDRLDFFVAELKKRGIYTNLNLNVGRTYKAGDGVADCELLGYAKALTYFDPRLLELQQEYARQLLTHRNAYTGNEYRHEPAVAIVELVNENSIVESWFSGRLLGQNTRKNPGTWTDIPASYERQLTELYNRWLGEQLSRDEVARLRAAAGVTGDAPLPRLKPAEFGKAPKERFCTEARFYMDLERRYVDMMQKLLGDELGVKSLLVGTSDHNHGRSGYPLLMSTARLDVVDGHVYWQHPHYLTDAAGKQIGFDIPNTPMVNDPQRSTVVQLARSAMAGKPYTISEVNHPYPNEYACEGLPILAAYAALQDWDGLFWYTLTHEPVIDEKPRTRGHFDFAPDPQRMTQLVAGAVMFLRGDVRPAKQTVRRSYSKEQVYESLRMSYAESPLFTPGLPKALPLIHGMRIAGFDRSVMETPVEKPVEPFVSDTGELRWANAAKKLGVVTVDTPKSQALVGFLAENAPSTKNLTVQLDTRFAAVTLSAIDDRPIAQSKKLLLTATARTANTGQVWNEKRTTLENWGAAPRLIEPVTGVVSFKNLSHAKQLKATPLSASGVPLGESLPGTRVGEHWELKFGTPATTMWVVEVER